MKQNPMLFGTRLIWRTSPWTRHKHRKQHRNPSMQTQAVPTPTFRQTNERISPTSISSPQTVTAPVSTDRVSYPTLRCLFQSVSTEAMEQRQGTRVPAASSVVKPLPHASIWRSTSAFTRAKDLTRASSVANASTVTLIWSHTSAATLERNLIAVRSVASRTRIWTR